MATETRRVWLPSGERVLVRIDRDASMPRAKTKQRGLFADVLALLASPRLIVEHTKPAERIPIERYSLRDFHVLRDLAVRARLLPSEPEVVACDNCDEELSFDPASLPLEDLDDRYEGEEPAAETRVDLAQTLRVGSLDATHARMRPITVADVRPLWRALGADRAFRVSPKLLGAMGLVSLEAADGTRVTDLRAIANALGDAPDATWSRVEEAFLALAYPPRAIASITCPRCETVHDLEVPWPRELEPGQYHPRRDEAAPFPSAAEFEVSARRVADATFRRLDAGALVLRVEMGVPEVDSGGVPMLGSYAPEPRDDGGTDFVVRIYYRTFERAFRDDASFDWERELDETLEHEAQHHIYYLSGHDPMDELERAQSERELVRRVGGEKRYRKLQQRAVLADVWEIVRVLVPALALVALAVLVLSRCAP